MRSGLIREGLCEKVINLRRYGWHLVGGIQRKLKALSGDYLKDIDGDYMYSQNEPDLSAVVQNHTEQRHDTQVAPLVIGLYLTSCTMTTMKIIHATTDFISR